MDIVVEQFAKMIVNDPSLISGDQASAVYRDFAVRMLSWVSSSLPVASEEYRALDEALALLPDAVMEAAFNRFDGDDKEEEPEGTMDDNKK